MNIDGKNLSKKVKVQTNRRKKKHVYNESKEGKREECSRTAEGWIVNRKRKI